MSETLNKARNEVKNIIGSMMVNDTFLGLLLKKTWIYADYETPTAYTEGLSIYINPNYFLKLEPVERKFVLLHELMHILLKHTLRQKEFIRKYSKYLDPLTMNVLADAKCNQYIRIYKSYLEKVKPIFPEDVEKVFNVEDVEKKSLEELMDELAKEIEEIEAIIVIGGKSGEGIPLPPWIKIKPKGIIVQPNEPTEDKPKGKPCSPIDIDIPFDIPIDVFGKGEGKEKEHNDKVVKLGEGEKSSKKEKEVINEGDKEDKEAKTPEEQYKRWIRKVSETVITVKTAGLLPGHYEELINELLKPIIDWRRILRSTLTKGIGRNVKRTWSRPSRKIPELYPGKETLKLNKTVVLIDTSGSIGTKELQRFVSEVYGVLREVSKVVVVMWDAEVEDVIEVRSHNDIEKVKVIKGRGGTCIKPALELVNDKFNDVDKIIIFSDWEIADLKDAEPLLKKYASKIIAFTTYKKPPKYLESYKIEITD
jgi:predicted metal-dependent peptidase